MDCTQNKRRTSPLDSASRLLVLLVILSLGAGGCGFLGLDGGDTQSGDSQQAQAPAVKPPPAAPEAQLDAPVKEEYERPAYPDQIRRNPFLPEMDVVRPTRNVARGEVRPKDPLEQYSLGQLNLVAIISSVAVPKAMFLDPVGFGHVVKKGDRIGLSGGIVSDIRDNEVEIREVSEGLDSETRLSTIKLTSDQLREDDDESLSDEEREALRRLLESEQGRRVLQESLNSGADAAPQDADSMGAAGQGRP
ncbi:pilus assembly protein PilP [Bradymonas sediminis]|nr:pilus assembly protein PilP [Bradymonas sediminis]TDP77496.1 Tfp pilus assembly protein PilP [Bradymonas sediminis]